MLQESTQAAAATGGNAAAALTQMGVDHLLGEMTSNPGAYAVSWAVLITLTIMSAMSIYWIVINFFKNVGLRRSADRVVSTFWETPNAQDAIRFMEEQKKSEPFSKIALDAAQAAAHHQRHEGSRLVESLNRSEFVDRALRLLEGGDLLLERGLLLQHALGLDVVVPEVGERGVSVDQRDAVHDRHDKGPWPPRLAARAGFQHLHRLRQLPGDAAIPTVFVPDRKAQHPKADGGGHDPAWHAAAFTTVLVVTSAALTGRQRALAEFAWRLTARPTEADESYLDLLRRAGLRLGSGFE